MTEHTHIHLIGIGGTGLSAIARVLFERGIHISGSDRQLSTLAAQLQSAGVVVFVGHKVENVTGASLVIRSSAIQDDNVEVQAARARGIPVLKRADFLSQLIGSQAAIAVAGSHGKTTTTAMLAWCLSSLNLDPSFIVGGTVTNLGANAKAGTGAFFIIEADEYDYMFHGIKPQVAVVTNVEHDHPDCFPTPEDFMHAFQGFVQGVLPGGYLIICQDDPGAMELLAYARGLPVHLVTYGTSSAADYQAVNLVAVPGKGFSFDIHQVGTKGQEHETLQLCSIQLQVPGLHNVRNAIAAFVVGACLNLPAQQVADALSQFRGTGRRFEEREEIGGVLVVDDYAHHPTEIQATLQAARSRYPGRAIWAIWQPHTYSRTLTLWPDYQAAFHHADHLVVTGVYAAREQPPANFSMAKLVGEIAHPDAQYMPDFQQVVDHLLERTNPPAVLLVLSAGDADQISTMLEERLAQAVSLIPGGKNG